MQRRDFLKSLGITAGMLMMPELSTDAFARRGSKARPGQWRGFNLLNYFTAGHPEPFREEEFKWIHDWGFNYVRLPLSYWNWSRPGEYYEMDEKVLQDIDRAVEWGRKYDIHVSINLHRAPGYCVNPPQEPQDLFRDQEALEGCAYQWGVFARRYRKHSNKYLSFNLLNEVAKIPEEDYETAQDIHYRESAAGQK